MKGNECNMKGNGLNAKCTEHERKSILNEQRWKENKTADDIRWLSTWDAFTPTESWKIRTSCLQGAHHLRKRKSTTKDNVILGNLNRYGVFIQLQLGSGQFAGKSQLGATLGRWSDPAKGCGVSRCGKEPGGARWTNGVVWLGKRHFPVNHSEVESRPKLEANQQLVRDEAKKNQQMPTNLGFYKLKLADWWCPFFGWWVLHDPWCMVG